METTPKPSQPSSEHRDQLITFRDGFTMRTSVVVWYIEASWRLHFTVTPDGRLTVGPRTAVTPEDGRFIRQHRDELLACTRYCDQQAEAPC
jgi:hypothetical protein